MNPLLHRFNIYFVRAGKQQFYAQVYTGYSAESIKHRFSDLINHRADAVQVIPTFIVEEEVLVDEDLFE